ncbi:hypothetical protein [Aliiroseovarius sp.]|nr:hypothetical protein [Aliiroseovarius sp.]
MNALFTLLELEKPAALADIVPRGRFRFGTAGEFSMSGGFDG